MPDFTAGEQVVEAFYFNQVGGARHWFTPAPQLTTIVPVRLLLHTPLTLGAITGENPLPTQLPKE